MVFPKISYGLFAVRDVMTISSSFIFKKDFTIFLHNYMPNNTADFFASLTLPIVVCSQTISTPIPIFAIDIYQRPLVNFTDRLKKKKKVMYSSVCTGRVIRVIPAFCIGGFINDMLRNRL